MSEPLSILLHAAARGARLQTRISEKYWIQADFDDLMYTFEGKLRIHPRDHHLRYGPISRVLFEAAKNPPRYLFGLNSAAAQELSYEYIEIGLQYLSMRKKSRSFYLLFVAEALAHEGL